MNITKVISTSIKEGVRFIKLLRFGKSEVQECREIAPFGIDSNSPKDMIAIYSPTQEKGKSIVIGYINKNQLADIGELRMYSTDSNQVEKFFLHLKNDGTAEFGGNSDFMVRYNALETGFNLLKTELNAAVTIFNSHVHPYTGLVVGTSGNTAPTVTPGIPAVATITAAKITEIKTL